MASITTAQAALFSRPDPITGLYQSAPVVDQFVDHIKWRAITGVQVRVVVVAAANFGSAAWIAAGGATTDSSSVPTDPATTYDLKRTTVDLLLDTFSEEIYRDDTPENVKVLQAELDAKLVNIRYKMGDALVNSTGASNDPKGLIGLVVAGNTVGANNDAANGGALLMSDVDRLLNKITANKGRADALVMNLAVLQKWKALFTANGSVPRVGIDPVTGEKCFYHGIVKILVSDWIPNNETKGAGTNLSSMYAVVLGWDKGLAGAYKPGGSGKMFEVERVMVAANDQHRYRVSTNITYPLFTDAALARLNGIA